MKKAIDTLVVLFALAVGSPALSQTVPLAELQQRCEDAREEKIAPLREAAIEECVSSRRSTRGRAECERIYADFGEGGGIVGGARRPPMFLELPECVEYFEARNRQRREGSRR
jgi:hypothetical protein